MRESEVEVLVVGAGPTGLMLANELARWGVKANAMRVVEKSRGVSEFTKAIVVQVRTLELYEDLGIVDQALAKGSKFNAGLMYLGPKQAVRFSLKELGGRYKHALILPQCLNEEILLGNLTTKFGKGYGVDYETELVTLKQDEGNARVRCVVRNVATGEEETIMASYVVGCDGAHSAVRKQAGMPFAGKQYPSEFLLCDCELDWEDPSEVPEAQLGEHEALVYNVDRLILLMPYMKGRYRIMSNRTQEHAGTSEVSLEEVKQAVNHLPGPRLKIIDQTWMTAFKLHARAVAHYSRGRVFLAGDSAHVHSPVGGQGMNTGLQDSYNLAWKLAMVVNGVGGKGLLKTYDEERQPVGHRLLATTDAAFSIILGRGFMWKFLKLLVFSSIGRWALLPILQHRGPMAASMLGINYRERSLSMSCGLTRKHPLRAGDRAPDVERFKCLGDGDELCTLFDIFNGPHFTLLVVARQMCDLGKPYLSQALRELRSWLERCNLAPEMFTVAVIFHSGTDAKAELLPTSMFSQLVLSGAYVASTEQESLLSFEGTYGVDTGLVCVRPDGHVGYIAEHRERESSSPKQDSAFETFLDKLSS